MDAAPTPVPPIPRGPRRPLAGAARHPDLHQTSAGPVPGGAPLAHAVPGLPSLRRQAFAVIEVSRARRLAGSQTVGGGCVPMCRRVWQDGLSIGEGNQEGDQLSPNERPGLGEAAALEKPGSNPVRESGVSAGGNRCARVVTPPWAQLGVQLAVRGTWREAVPVSPLP